MFLPPGAAEVAFIMNAGCLWMKCIRSTSLPVILFYLNRKGSTWFPDTLLLPTRRPTVRASNPVSSGFKFLHTHWLIWGICWHESGWQQLVNRQSSVSVSGECENYCLLRCDVFCSGRQVPTFRIYISQLNTAPLLGWRCSTLFLWSNSEL